jgi:arylsulfatase A-like enzyme
MDVLYKASITMVDAWIGRFLDEADGRGLLDDTMIVFMSDHGILLGEHDLTGKPPSDSMWPEMTDVPLIIRHPDGPRGITADLFVSTHDIAPTILGAAGLTPAAPLDGIDLSPLVVSREGGDVERRDHVSQMYDTKFTVRTDRYMFVASDEGGTRRLFDLQEDPGATTDVADRQAADADRLWELLLEDAGGELPQWDREAIAAHLAAPPTSPPTG